MKQIVVATNNKNKLKEIKDILSIDGVEFLTLEDVGIDLDVEENMLTLKLNAEKKAKEYYEVCKLPVISEDMGLFVDALDNMPGVHSKRWLDGTDEDRNEGILSNLVGIEAHLRTARYMSCFSFFDGTNLITCKGTCEGFIDTVISGDNGFAYDKIFIHESGKKISDMTVLQKNDISHRMDGLVNLKNELLRLNIV